MRLFIAITFDEQIKNRIIIVQEKIREKAKKGKFPPAENFHLTLVFLGETPQERLPDIKAAMEQAASVDEKPNSPFELVFNKTGFFKRGAKELWWLGMNATKKNGMDKRNSSTETGLEKLQGRLVSELLARNFKIDSRPYTPHITLGREIISDLWPFETENIIVPFNRLSLMLSEHKPVSGKKNKLVYTELFHVNC